MDCYPVPQIMHQLSIAALLLVSPAFAQGGERHFQMHGSSAQDSFGTTLSKAGDVNADGYPDFILGGWDSNYAVVYSGFDNSVIYRLFNVGPYRKFGRLVAGGGDVDADGFDDLLVAAVGDYQGGGVYVFLGFDGSLLHRIESEIASAGQLESIDLAEDVNLDGHADILIGAGLSDLGGIGNSGSVFLFSGIDGSLMHRFDGTTYYEQLGFSLSSAGDTNADGYPDILIGSPYGWTDTIGHAQVFSGRDWSLLFRVDGIQIRDQFGISVSDAGDLDQDGHDDIIVGASSDSVPPGYSGAGSAAVFSGADGHRMHYLATGLGHDRFGKSVSAAGDVNADGYPDFMVSAIGPVNWGALPGRTFVYSGRDGQLLHTIRGGKPSDVFGTAIADVGDTDQDGFADILIGAHRTNPLGAPRGAGSVYLYYLEPFLSSDGIAISRSLGGSIDLNLDFPDSEAYAPYQVLASRRGIGHTALKGASIPLRRDGLFQFLLHGGQLPMLSNARGVLDQDGNATATLHVPSMAPVSLVGTKRWFSATSWEPGLTAVRQVSIAVSIEILP